MLPQAYISHSSKGRIRFRIPSRQNDHGYFTKICNKLENCDFIHLLQANATTASLLVLHNSEISRILELGREFGLFELVEAEVLEQAAKLFLNGEKPHPNSAMIKGLVGLGLVQILRGQVLAPASTLFMDAYRMYKITK